MSIDGFINNVNSFQQNLGAVQGAADAIVPAVYAVDNAVNQVASVFTGDTYQTGPYYPPVAPVSLTGGPKAGLIGSMLAGGVVGGVMGGRTADALRAFKTEGIGAGMKQLGSASLKSGLMGAGLMGAVSGIKNFAAASRGEITHAQAGGNVAADTIGGLLAGTGGGLTSGMVSMFLPAGGLVATIGAAVAGAVGATGVNLLYDGSGARDSLASKLSGAFGGTPAPQTYYPQQSYGY